MMMALEASSSPPQQQGYGSSGSESLLANVLVGSSGLHTKTTSSKAPSGKGTSKSKKKTQSKSSKQHSGSNSTSSNSSASGSSSTQQRAERKDEEIYLEAFVKSIDYLPTEVRKDLVTIRELDKKASKNVTLSTELASDSSKSTADRIEAIRKLMDESINLSEEKVDISQRSLNKITLHIDDLDHKIEELAQKIQQKQQNTFKLESLYIPQLSEDNQVHYFTPSDPSLQSSSSKSNKRLVQHSENLKTLKSGSLKSYPEKEMHAHVFNHTPEQEGIVRGNSTTTRNYASSSSSTKKAAEKETPSQITVKTSTGNVISVPNDKIGNSDATLVSISSEQKVKKQKKSSQSKPESAPVNLTPLSINTTSVSTTSTTTAANGKKDKSSTSSVSKENSITSSEISSIRIPKKDSSSASSSNNTQTASQSSSTKKSRSTTSSSASASNSTSSSSSSSTAVTTSEQSKTGKKRKPISTSNSGKTKKQKQSNTTTTTPIVPSTEQIPQATVDNTLIYEENLYDPTPYCYCKKTMAEDSSDMIGCDNDKCPNNGWIHRHCLLPSEDPEVSTFYCSNCIKNKKKKKK